MDAGREAMFRQWMREHLTLLHRIARGFAPPSDQPDLLQELMLAVWRALPAFRGDSQPVTFIYRVAHNRPEFLVGALNDFRDALTRLHVRIGVVRHDQLVRT